MKIAMTMAPCWRLQFNLSDLYPVPRLGIAQIASTCQKHGHQMSMVDVIAERWEPPQFGQWVRQEQPDVVGISVTILSMREAFQLARVAKESVPGVRTVIGGPGVGGWTPEELFEYGGEAVDFFVRGEGEAATLGLLQALEASSDLSQVGGLLWRKCDGSVAENTHTNYLSLDDIPGPNWDLLPMEQYKLHPPLGIYPYATMLETARGCSYPCNFCCLSRPVRVRSIEWVTEQLTELHNRFDVQEVHFVDPTFTLDRDRALALCDAIAQLPFTLHWSCKTRVDHIDDELAGAMAASGCYNIAFGVESGADLVLDHMKKKATAPKTREAFRTCRKHGIRTIAYCLVAGPAETQETIEQTRQFVRDIQADYVLYGILDPDPNNALTQAAIEEGRFTRRDLAEYYLGHNPSSLHQTTITGYPIQQAQQWLRKASTDFYLRPRYMWSRVRDLRSLQDARNLMGGGTHFLRDLLDISRHWRRRSVKAA